MWPRLDPLGVRACGAVLTGVDRCAIVLREPACGFCIATAYALRAELAEPYQGFAIEPGDLPLLDDACRLGQPLVVEDAGNSPRVPEAWRQRFGSCTLLAVPLMLADEPIGAFLVDDAEAHKRADAGG